MRPAVALLLLVGTVGVVAYAKTHAATASGDATPPAPPDLTAPPRVSTRERRGARALTFLGAGGSAVAGASTGIRNFLANR